MCFKSFTMDLFIELHYHQCDDYYYGYNEKLITIYESFDKAKKSIDSFLDNLKPFRDGSILKYDGKDGNPYILIVKMKMGESNQETLFSSHGSYE